MNALADLCAGPLPRTTAADQTHTVAIRHLHNSIARSAAELKRNLRSRKHWKRVSRLVPLVARKLTEECATAVLGRLDPLRLVVAFKGAKSADFDWGGRNESSIIWGDDIVCDFKPSTTVWSQGTLKKGIARGLLDGHLAAYVFESAHERVVDAVEEFYRSRLPLPHWASRIQQFPEGPFLLADLRRRASESYSYLSKGIHFEFYDTASTLEQSAAMQSIENAMYVVGTAALYSHLCDTSLRRLQVRTMMQRFDEVVRAFSYTPSAPGASQ